MLRIAWTLALGFLPCLVFADAGDDQYRVAAEHYSNSRWGLAADEFRDLLERFPNHGRTGDALFYLGESAVQQRDYPAARDAFGLYITRHADGKFDRQARFRLGEIAYFLDDQTTAEMTLRDFLGAYGAHTTAGVAATYLGEVLLRVGRFDEALPFFIQGAEARPVHRLVDKARLGVIECLNRTGRAEEALILAAKLADQSNKDTAAEAKLRQGAALYELGRFTEAAAILADVERQNLDERLTTKAKLARAWALVRLDLYSDAEELFEQLASSPAVEAEAALGLSATQSADGRYDLAQATLRAALEKPGLDRDMSISMRVRLANALVEYERLDEAEELFKSLSGETLRSPWDEELAWGQLRWASRKGDWAEVERLAQEYLQEYPMAQRRDAVRRTWAQSLIARDDPSRAVNILDSNSENGASDAAEEYLLGVALQRLGRLDEAAAAFVHAAADPTMASKSKLALALVRIDQERWADAIAILEPLPTEHDSAADAERHRAALIHSYINVSRIDDALRVLLSWGRTEQVATSSEMGAASMLRVASALLAAERHEEAAPLYTALIESRQEEWVRKGRLGLAWCLSQADDLPHAAREFEAIVKDYPDHPVAAEALLAQARIVERLGLTDKAAVLFQQITREHAGAPQAEEAMLSAAGLAVRVKNVPRGVQLYEQFLREFHSSDQIPTALYELAWIELERGDARAAAARFEQIHAEFPESPYWTDATYRLAEAAQRKGDDAAALEWIGELLENSRPDDALRPFALYLKGQVQIARQEWAKARELMQRLVTEYPHAETRDQAEFWQAEAMYRLELFEDALQHFSALEPRILNQENDWADMVPIRRAQCLAHLKKWTEARELAEQIRGGARNPSRLHEVDYLIGRCLAAQAEFDAAREAYSRVINSTVAGKSETAAMAQWMVGETYFHQRDFPAAIRAYLRTRILYAYPRWQAAALLQAAKCYEALDEPAEAERLYGELIDEFPESEYRDEATHRRQRLQRNPTKVATVQQ